MPTFTHTLSDGENFNDVEVTYNPGYYTPAKLSGNPDNWCPAEGEDPEIISVIDADGKDILPGLTDETVNALVKAAWDDQNNNVPDYEDYYYYDDDIGHDDWQNAQSDWERSQGI